MKIMDLEIDFPEIDGVTVRQINYAEYLREEYVCQNEERFHEINDIVQSAICSHIMTGEDTEEKFEALQEELSKEEIACLFGINAGHVIGALKNVI